MASLQLVVLACSWLCMALGARALVPVPEQDPVAISPSKIHRPNGHQHLPAMPVPAPGDRPAPGHSQPLQTVPTTRSPLCSIACPQVVFPICGSDGNTYGNSCFMHLVACRLNKTITLEHNGPCEGGSTSTSASTEKPRKICSTKRPPVTTKIGVPVTPRLGYPVRPGTLPPATAKTSGTTQEPSRPSLPGRPLPPKIGIPKPIRPVAHYGGNVNVNSNTNTNWN